MNKIFKIAPGFDSGTANATLLVEVSAGHFFYGIVEEPGNLLRESGYYKAEPGDDDFLSDMFAENIILKNPFRKVVIAYHFSDSVLSPAELFRQQQTRELLNQLHGTPWMDTMVPEFIGNFSMYNQYTVPQHIHKSMVLHFVRANYWHGYSVRLKNIDREKHPGQHFFLDFRTDNFLLTALTDGNPYLVQIYDYEHPADVLYILLKVCSFFPFTQEEVVVHLAGLVEKDSGIYSNLYKYFKHVEFEEFSGSVKLDPAFKEYPSHYYSVMDKLLQCV